jgi:hypothetical protein
MRIVDTDNFGGDYPNERFLLWEMPQSACERICGVLNEQAGPNAHRYYKIVEDDYVLVPGFEP